MAGQYTPPGGNNPASSQLQQGNSQQLIAAANYNVSNGQPLDPAAVAATQNAYKGANAEVMNLNTQPVRQQYIDDTSYNKVQSNYQDLAQQLAGYDQAILKPQFAGQDPGMPTDMPAGFNPDVTMSGISMNTPGSAQLPASQGIYNSNPIYGFNAQFNQGNNLVGLLQTLNSVLGKEYDMGTNKHSADLKSAAATLQGLGDILKMNTDLEMKRAELRASASSKATTDKDIIGFLAAKLKSVAGPDGYVSPTDWAEIKKLGSGLSLPPTDFDSQFSLYRNPKNPYYRVEDPFAGLTGTQKTNATKLGASLDQLSTFKKQQGGAYQGTGIVEGNFANLMQNAPYGLNSFADPNLVSLQSRIGPLRDTVLNYLSGAGVTGSEQKRVLAWLPDITKSPQKNAEDIISLTNYLNDNYRNTTGKDYLAFPTDVTPGGGGGQNDPLGIR